MPVWLIVLSVLAVAYLLFSFSPERRRRRQARRQSDLAGADGTINVGERWRTGGYMEGGGGG